MKRTCAICGKPSGMYPLCTDCFKLRDEGKIKKCEECGTWFLTEQGCPNCQTQKNIPAETAEKTEESDELTCLLCGKPSNGKHFCYVCYKKYKDRAIDIRISHCKDVEILDEYGNLTIKCDDGRKVRSRAEAMISNWLYKETIRSVYEKTIFYKENGEDKTLHPDFFLPDFDLYIEYNEITSKPYLKSKEYTKKIYESLGYRVLIMSEKDLQDIEACLKPILGLH